MKLDVEYAIKTDIRNNPVVRQVDIAQKREFVQTTCVVGLIVAMLLFSAWQQLKIVRHGYDVETVRQELEAEASLNRQLRLDLETYGRPQLIEERAREELRFAPASLDETIILERVAPATPASAVIADAR